MPRLSGDGDMKRWANEIAHRVDQELAAIQKSITGDIAITRTISVGGGGGSGGGTVTVNIRHIVQPVSAAGDVTVSFADVGVSTYGVIAYVLTLIDGQLNNSLALPLIPPYSVDTRSRTSVGVRVFEQGTLYVSILVPT